MSRLSIPWRILPNRTNTHTTQTPTSQFLGGYFLEQGKAGVRLKTKSLNSLADTSIRRLFLHLCICLRLSIPWRILPSQSCLGACIGTCMTLNSLADTSPLGEFLRKFMKNSQFLGGYFQRDRQPGIHDRRHLSIPWRILPGGYTLTACPLSRSLNSLADTSRST